MRAIYGRGACSGFFTIQCRAQLRKHAKESRGLRSGFCIAIDCRVLTICLTTLLSQRLQQHLVELGDGFDLLAFQFYGVVQPPAAIQSDVRHACPLSRAKCT